MTTYMSINKCINTKSREFKKLSEQTELSNSALELVLHSMMVEGKLTDDHFPTIDEINERIQPSSFISNTDQLEVWTKEFSRPKYFTNDQDQYINDYVERASSLFGKESVKVLDVKNSSTKVIVGQPSILPFNFNTNIWKQIEDELINLGGPVSTLLKEYINLYKQLNKFPTITSAIIDKVKTKNSRGEEYEFEPVALGSKDGVVFNIRRLVLNMNNTPPALRKRVFLSILAHELTHNITLGAINNAEAGKGTPEEITFYNEINRLYRVTKNSLGDNASSIYGLNNVKEFIAELASNKGFQVRLSEIKDTKTNKSILNRILKAFHNFFSKYFKRDISKSVLESGLTALTDYMDYIRKTDTTNNTSNDVSYLRVGDVNANTFLSFRTMTDFIKFLQSKIFNLESSKRNGIFKGNIISAKRLYNSYWLKKKTGEDLNFNTKTSKEAILTILNNMGIADKGVVTLKDTENGTKVIFNRPAFYHTREEMLKEAKEAKEFENEILNESDKFDFNILSRVDAKLADEVRKGNIGIEEAKEMYEQENGVSIYYYDNPDVAFSAAFDKNSVDNIGSSMQEIDSDYKSILDKAQRDKDGNLLAPNGKKSNLTEEQYALVRTKEFIDKFGDWENPTIFTANNVDNAEVLQEKYPSALPNKFYHHSTNSFGKQPFDVREGTKERLHIIGRLTTDKVDVLVVENPNSNNKTAHITLATAEGIKPFESNKELELHKDEIQPLDDYVDTTFKNNLRRDIPEGLDKNWEPDFNSPQVKSVVDTIAPNNPQQEPQRHQKNDNLNKDNGKSPNKSKDNTKKDSITEFIENQRGKMLEIDNLLDSDLMTSTEVMDIAEQAVYWISDEISRIQEQPNYAVEMYGDRFKDIDFSKKDRIDVVNTIGLTDIIERCKLSFSSEYNEYISYSEDPNIFNKADLITDNWNGIMMLAKNRFGEVENFSITSTTEVVKSNTDIEEGMDVDNFSQSNDSEVISETEGSLQEHWQIESRSIDVMSTMSQMMKKTLISCYRMDSNGDYILSDFGVRRRVNIQEATQTILRAIQGALTLSEMIKKLDKAANSTPWLIQILDRLEDTSGNETEFKSQFFNVFSKYNQLYDVVTRDKGVFNVIPANLNKASTVVMNNMKASFIAGEHPLFDKNGVIEDKLTTLESFYGNLASLSKIWENEDAASFGKCVEILTNIYGLLGYYTTTDDVSAILNKDYYNKASNALFYITKALRNNLGNNSYAPFDYSSKDSISGNINTLLRPLTEKLGDTMPSSFYDNGKMYQTYVTPSYLTKLFKKFGLSEEDFDTFIEKEYAGYEFFHDGNDLERGWRNEWLRLMVTNPKMRETFKHKVQLNFNKKSYMKQMSSTDYALAMLAEYFDTPSNTKDNMVPAWFRVPIMSNKPSSEYVQFYKYVGTDYKSNILNGFIKVMGQELSRIQTVKMRRNLPNSKTIDNFDKKGDRFFFLPELNAYLNGDKASTELGKLLNAAIEGKNIDSAKLNTLAKAAILEFMETRVADIITDWESQGIIEGAILVKNVGSSIEEVKTNLENFIWNDRFASMNILQLTVTDLAYYKNAEDLQKRLGQLHSPGLRANTEATDFSGMPVTDGKIRTVYLNDFEGVISNVIENVSVIMDRKIEQAKNDIEREYYISLKEQLVGEHGLYRDINVTDGQAYNSITSYRKKALMFGKWSREAEALYEKIRKGDYSYTDMKLAFQPLKPFVYTQTTMDSGVKEAPLKHLKVGVQNKNSEYLLLMADALMQGEKTGRPNLLRAIMETMEESHYDENGNYKVDGIDTFQFKSAVKVGGVSAINLSDLVDNPKGEAIAKQRLKNAIYNSEVIKLNELNPKTGLEETIETTVSTGEYNPSIVTEYAAEDYCLQQEIPEHFKDHHQVIGSQSRYIVPSELAITDAYGNPVEYDVKGTKYNAKEFKARYEQLNADNIRESLDAVTELLKLRGTKLEKRQALSAILQKEILSDSRYGVNLLQACSLDSNGEFRMPVGDPIQSKRIEQLINSIIKNRVNKQEIAGGALVQVSNFGTSKKLSIRYKDKNGNLLKTKEEYEREQSELQSRGLVQSSLSRDLQIRWRETGKEGSGDSQGSATCIPELSSGRVHRNDNYVEALDARISEVSDKIDKELSKRGIPATKQKVKRASAQDFHNAIKAAVKENANGWMVTVHKVSEYEDNLCLLTEDGKSGIAVTRDGDIISVFSAVSKDHRLSKLMQMAIAAGGRKLDCYYQEVDGKFEGLPYMYAKFGFKVDSTTPFSEEAASEGYKEWKEKNQNKKMAGVAAMSLKNINSIEGYNEKPTPNIEDAQSFTGKDGYDNMLKYRDDNMAAIHSKTQSYEEYCKENQGDLAYYEAYAPAWSKSLFSKFTDKNGNISVEAIEALSEDLLEMISYRIPSEDKYSIFPIKIVGFLPEVAGETLMLPYDITLLTGADYDIDKMFIMLRELSINSSKISNKDLYAKLYKSFTEGKELSYEQKNAVSELIKMFINNPYAKREFVGAKTKGLNMTEAGYKRMLAEYVKTKFSLSTDSSRAERNNEILDMMESAITNKENAHLQFNPQSFDEQKKTGYLAEAYRLLGDKYSWEALEKMSISELKDLISTNKDLTLIDTHLNFYRQNSAAATLIGIFAVSKIAHAIIEGEGYGINTEVLKVNGGNFIPIDINGFHLGGIMELDGRNSINLVSINRILGSLVAASADAVKDPILNLMNINAATSNVLLTMIRLGMDFNTAGLFMSQKCISDLIVRFNKSNVTGRKSLKDIIKERLAEITKQSKLTDASKLIGEGITKEEIIKGIRSNNNLASEYKTLVAFANLLEMSNIVRVATFPTRYNSVVSATGPLIIDNIQHAYTKSDLTQIEGLVRKGEEGVYHEASLYDILADHPILKEFSKGYDIATEALNDSPLYSSDFTCILSNMQDTTNIGDKIIKNRKLLSNFCDFYMTYKFIKAGVVSPSEAKYILEQFPAEIPKIKSKYSDNPFVNAIILKTDKSNKIIIDFDTVGIQTQDKEKLGAGWLDLYRKEPEIAMNLFKYSFFRGGIGFNPKSFMNLLPLKMKELIPGYIDAINNSFVSHYGNEMLETFILNNTNNNSLVPLMKEVTLETMAGHDETYYNASPKDVSALLNVDYFKQQVKDTNGNTVTYIYKQIFTDAKKGIVCYKRVEALGNDGFFIEVPETNRETIEIHGESINSEATISTEKDDAIDADRVNPIEMTSEDYFNMSNTLVQQQDRLKDENITDEQSIQMAKELLDKQNIKYSEQELNNFITELRKLC